MFVMDIYHTKLGQDGFEVITALNGLEALKKLKEDNVLPDLILLDIMMPYLNGLEVLEEINRSEKLKKIPVILLTNLSQREEIEKGMGLGARDFLIKSHFTPSEVVKKINSILGTENEPKK